MPFHRAPRSAASPAGWPSRGNAVRGSAL